MTDTSARRVDRLLHLIESLQTADAGGTRADLGKTVGEQLRRLCAASPALAPAALLRLYALLKKREFEVRVAAAAAVAAVGAQLEGGGGAAAASDGDVGDALLTLESFDIEVVLRRGSPLMATAGREYEQWEDEQRKLPPEERLRRARSHLRKRLGIDAAGEGTGELDAGAGADYMDALVREEDLVTWRPAAGADAPAAAPEGAGGVDAAARRAMYKQRRAAEARPAADVFAQATKRQRFADGEPNGAVRGDGGAEASTSAAAAAGGADEGAAVREGRESLRKLCFQLLDDTLSPRWEVRHGAATCLRDVIGASRRRSAGSWAWMTSGWLEDCVSRVICVLALDRFGDYEGDAAVAPVREIAGQVLGAVLFLIPSERTLARAASMITKLANNGDDDVRYGGMIGLKYLFAVAGAADEGGALVREVLDATMPMIASVLGEGRDGDEVGAGDDVRAAGLDALIHVAARAGEACAALVGTLWAVLADEEGDEEEAVTTVSTNALRLLVELYAAGAGARPDAAGLPAVPELMRRTARFFASALRDTRLAAAALLRRLASSPLPPPPSEDAGPALREAVRMAALAIVREESAGVRPALEGAWEALVASTGSCARVHELLDAEIVSLCDNGAPGLLNVNAWPAFARDRDAEAEVLATRMRAARCLAAAVGAAEARGARSASSRLISERLGAACASASTVHRQFAAEVLFSLARGAAGRPASGIAGALGDRLMRELVAPAPAGEPPLFEETGMLQRRMRASHAALCEAAGLSAPPPESARSPEAAIQFAESGAARPAGAQARARLVEDANALRAANFAFGVAARVYQSRAALAAAAELPAKLTPLISPLMRTISAETEPLRVWTAAAATGLLMRRCVLAKKGAAGKVLSKLYRLIADHVLPPGLASVPGAMEEELYELRSDGGGAAAAYASTDALLGGALREDCVEPLVADRAARAAEVLDQRDVYRRIAPDEKRGRGRPPDPPKKRAPPAAEADLALAPDALALVNAEMALRVVVAAFDDVEALDGATGFWDSFFAPLRQEGAADAAVVGALHVVRAVADLLRGSPRLPELLRSVTRQCERDGVLVRMFAARACAALACAAPEAALPTMLAALSASLAEKGHSLTVRRGVSAALSEAGAHFRRFPLSYMIMLLVPLLKQMADPDDVVRGLATRTFSRMVPFFPLARDAPVPPGVSGAHAEALLADKRMLVQLLDNASVDDHELSFAPNSALRRYQQEGVNWLQFLRRFGMHGILADDMGLGKTLQTLCILAEALSGAGAGHQRCLIVCPNTLARHWALEAAKHIPGSLLRPLVVQGPLQERLAQRARLDASNMVVCSYETLRSDLEWFSSRHWLYCVLDEGHVVKNPKTKAAAAVREVGRRSSHRLVLSGTPVQNSPAELWGLFQFLMPGFLGSHAEFLRAYESDISRARSRAADADAIIACEDAAERLHRTVMPFILRRTKDGVLKDLPPKVIQDVLVDETPLQAALRLRYEDGAAEDGGAPRQHSFASCMFLRKLATHPALVFDGGSREHLEAARAALGAGGAAAAPAALQESVRRVDESPKLAGLRELLLGCGIGRPHDEEDGGPPAAAAAAAAGHRVLVFAQLTKVLDIVEEDLLGAGAAARGGLRGVSWLRLDGRTPSRDRVGIAERFNADPSIHVLLLTTQVGSLGLNLTAADTVVFLEHDWNPQRDLQAMDRAHRIGQRRSVSVYRLITRGTIEEDIMSLQRFKVGIAEAVVNQDNVSVDKMDTGALLDVFAKPAAAPAKRAGDAPAELRPFAKLIGSFDQLWDESEYGSEFSIAAFTANLRRQGEDGGEGEDAGDQREKP